MLGQAQILAPLLVVEDEPLAHAGGRHRRHVGRGDLGRGQRLADAGGDLRPAVRGVEIEPARRIRHRVVGPLPLRQTAQRAGRIEHQRPAGAGADVDGQHGRWSERGRAHNGPSSVSGRCLDSIPCAIEATIERAIGKVGDDPAADHLRSALAASRVAPAMCGVSSTLSIALAAGRSARSGSGLKTSMHRPAECLPPALRLRAALSRRPSSARAGSTKTPSRRQPAQRSDRSTTAARFVQSAARASTMTTVGLVQTSLPSAPLPAERGDHPRTRRRGRAPGAAGRSRRAMGAKALPTPPNPTSHMCRPRTLIRASS